MSTLIVRLARIEDAPAIAKIHIKTWQCAYRGQIPDDFLDQLSVEKRTQVWQERLADENSKIKTLVAEREGVIIGFCSIGPNREIDGIGELMALYVDQDFFGQGVGSALNEAGLKYLKDHGFNKATLWVLETNDPAKKFYEKQGWRTDGKTKIDKRDNLEFFEIRYSIEF